MCDTIRYLELRSQGHTKTSQFHHSQKRVRQLLEDHATKPAINQSCKFSGEPRATFLVDFSPNKRRAASTHGDHTVRVTDILSGKCTHVLTGHPRTPWCLAFNPVSDDILASGCLGGEVRIWDLHGGGSEVLQNPNEGQVITSLAFSPSGDAVVFATLNKIYFWAWTRSKPFALTQTNYEFERVRWLRFDPFGRYLYTGIANNSSGRRASAEPASNRWDNTSEMLGLSSERASNRSRYEVIRRFVDHQYANSHQAPGPSQSFLDMSRPRSPVNEERLTLARQYARHVTALTSGPSAVRPVPDEIGSQGLYSNSRAGAWGTVLAPALSSRYQGSRAGTSSTEGNVPQSTSSSAAAANSSGSTFGFGHERRGRWGRYRPAFFSLSSEDQSQENRDFHRRIVSSYNIDLDDNFDGRMHRRLMSDALARVASGLPPALPPPVPISPPPTLPSTSSPPPTLPSSSSPTFHPFSVRREVSLGDGLETDEFEILPVDQGGDNEVSLTENNSANPLSTREERSRLSEQAPERNPEAPSVDVNNPGWNDLQTLWARCSTNLNEAGPLSRRSEEASSTEAGLNISTANETSGLRTSTASSMRSLVTGWHGSVSRPDGGGPLLNANPFMGHTERNVEFSSEVSNRSSDNSESESQGPSHVSQNGPAEVSKNNNSAEIATSSTTYERTMQAYVSDRLRRLNQFHRQKKFPESAGQGSGKVEELSKSSKNTKSLQRSENMSACSSGLSAPPASEQSPMNESPIQRLGLSNVLTQEDTKDTTQASGFKETGNLDDGNGNRNKVTQNGAASAEMVNSEEHETQADNISSNTDCTGLKELESNVEMIGSNNINTDSTALETLGTRETSSGGEHCKTKLSCGKTCDSCNEEPIMKEQGEINSTSYQNEAEGEEHYKSGIQIRGKRKLPQGEESSLVCEDIRDCKIQRVAHDEAETEAKTCLEDNGASQSNPATSRDKKIEKNYQGVPTSDLVISQSGESVSIPDLAEARSSGAASHEQQSTDLSMPSSQANSLTPLSPSGHLGGNHCTSNMSSGAYLVGSDVQLRGNLPVSNVNTTPGIVQDNIVSGTSSNCFASTTFPSTVCTGSSQESMNNLTVSTCDVTAALTQALAAVHCSRPSVSSGGHQLSNPFHSIESPALANVSLSSSSLIFAAGASSSLSSSLPTSLSALNSRRATLRRLYGSNLSSAFSVCNISNQDSVSNSPATHRTSSAIFSHASTPTLFSNSQLSAAHTFPSTSSPGDANGSTGGGQIANSLSSSERTSTSSHPWLRSLFGRQRQNVTGDQRSSRSARETTDVGAQERLEPTLQNAGDTDRETSTERVSDPPETLDIPLVERLENLSRSMGERVRNLSRTVGQRATQLSQLQRRISTLEETYNRRMRLIHSEYIYGTDTSFWSRRPVDTTSPSFRPGAIHQYLGRIRRSRAYIRPSETLSQTPVHTLRRGLMERAILATNRELRNRQGGVPPPARVNATARDLSNLRTSRAETRSHENRESSTLPWHDPGNLDHEQERATSSRTEAVSSYREVSSPPRALSPWSLHLLGASSQLANQRESEDEQEEEGERIGDDQQQSQAEHFHPDYQNSNPEDAFRRLQYIWNRPIAGGVPAPARVNATARDLSNLRTSRAETRSQENRVSSTLPWHDPGNLDHEQERANNRNRTEAVSSLREVSSPPRAPSPGSLHLLVESNQLANQRESEDEQEEEEERIGDDQQQSQAGQLHPDYESSSLEDVFHRLDYMRNNPIAGTFWARDEHALASNFIPHTHRIQRWCVLTDMVPDISDSSANIVVRNCKLHNDASCSLSRDGKLLAAFVPTHRGFPDKMVLGVFSLEKDTFSQCLYTKSFGPNAISVSISPQTNYVLVGTAAKRMFFFSVNQMVGQVYKMVKQKAGESSMRHITDLLYYPENRTSFCSVNSACWLPEAGMGLVFGTNKGDLVFSRPGSKRKIEREPYFYRSTRSRDSFLPHRSIFEFFPRRRNLSSFAPAATVPSENSNSGSNSANNNNLRAPVPSGGSSSSTSGWRSSGTQTTRTSDHRSAATQTREDEEEEEVAMI